MTVKELEQRIADASEGSLSGDQLKQLETDLENYPELKVDFERIMKLPPVQDAYPVQSEAYFSRQIMDIKRAINLLDLKEDSFAEISFTWFRQYALAASVLIIALSAALYVPGGVSTGTVNEQALEEFFMPFENETMTDEYVVYLDELTEE